VASHQQPWDAPPSYSRCPTTNEQVLAVAPDFPLAVEAIRLVQEWFPGTSAGDAWEFIQQLAHLVRADVWNRQSNRTGTNRHDASEGVTEDDPPSSVPEDSPMPDASP